MTNAELAILSLVAERPSHGYQIESTIETRGMRDWTEIGFSSIYYILNKLEKKKLVSSRFEPAEQGPARKVYSITPDGSATLQEEIIQALSTPHPRNASFLLGLANLPTIRKPKAIQALKQYLQGLVEKKAELQVTQERQLPLPDHVQAMFDHSLALIHAELDWLESVIEKLEDKK